MEHTTPTVEDWRFVDTKTLAELFGKSERYIQLLVKGGVIESCGTARKLRFDLYRVVGQYASFLQSDVPLNEWAPEQS